MVRRKTYTLLVAGTFVLLAISATANAQDQVVVRAWPSFTSTPPETVELDSTLREDFPMNINLAIDGTFVCAQAITVTVEILVPTFPPWAGMSLVPDSAKVASFEVDGQGPWGPESQPGPVFNIAWQDDAPTNDTVHYEVVVDEVAVDTEAGAEPCIANPAISTAAGNAVTGTALLNVTRPWAPPVEGEEVDCTIEPEHPQCIEEANRPNEGGDSPGFGVVVLIGALAAAAFVSRRRQ